MGNPSLTAKVPAPLSAQDRSSFAYKTIKDRLPVILVKTIDFLHRQRKELSKYGGTLSAPNGEESVEMEADAKEVIAQLAKLRKDLETNKPVQLFAKLDLDQNHQHFNDDVEIWNKTLEAHKHDDQCLPRWFEAPWLLVECYLYRRIKDAMLKTKHLKSFDPFVEQKQVACRSSVPQMILIADHLIMIEKIFLESANHSHPSERGEFSLFMQLALWANKSDLSISGMSADGVHAQKITKNIRESLEDLRENILCDNMSEAWFKIQSIKGQARSSMNQDDRVDPITIDLVADNSGYEIFVDLCLIHFLTLMMCGTQDVHAIKFRIHVKRMPWFVSDALPQDIDWLLNFLTDVDREAALQELGTRWKYYIESKCWEIHEHKFWTLPHDYSEMKTVAEDLYQKLSKSSFIIFKGDLNYRKLTGDRKWHILTPFRVALRDFSPAPLVALRTAKADVVVGIEDINIYAQINNNELPHDWMISGDYGLIQFLDPL